MRLESLSFESYKPFSDRFDLKFRPLTIFLGRNGAGKSAVIRLIPLLMSAIGQQRDSGLPLEVGGIKYGELFTDLVHNKYPHGNLTVGASFSHKGQVLQFETKIQELYNSEEDSQDQVIAKFRSQIGDTNQVTLTWLRRESQKRGAPFYDVQVGENRYQGNVIFKGIIPELPELAEPQIEWWKNVAEYAKRLVHIGPIRSLGERYYSRAEKRNDFVDLNGANAAHILEAGGNFLLEKVNQWFSQPDLGGRRVSLKLSGPVFEVFLGKGSVATHLNEVGQGMNQVFPIVVQRFLPVSQPRIEIVEEPESHLHPGAHAAVADLFWQGVKEAGLQMVVETHSEVFLLRIRRAVAEGWIQPEDVILYWVDDEGAEFSEIVPLYIKADGEVENWPAEVFSEDYREALAIRRSQRQQRGTLDDD